MWRKKTAGRWLLVLGVLGGAIAMVAGVIGCLWQESVAKYLCLGMVVAVFVFFFLRMGEEALLCLLKNGKESRFCAQVREVTGRRLSEAAESVRALSAAFAEKQISDGDGFEEFAVLLPEAVCVGCEKCMECWQDKLPERCEAAYAMFVEAETGTLPDAAEIEERFEGCERAGVIAEEYAAVCQKEQTKRQLKRRTEEGKSAVAVQLQIVSELLKDCSKELGEMTDGDDHLKEELAQNLFSEGVVAEEIDIRTRKGRGMQVRLTARARNGKPVAVRRLNQCIGMYFDRPFQPDREAERFIGERECELAFEEEAGYFVLTGVARAAKFGETRSGDSYSFLYSENGETAMLLSDGMGSGARAGSDSTEVIDLLERLLSAGFDEKSAVRLINSVLLLRTEGSSFSTADISVINAYAGTCEFIKLGAAATYIKRENWMESVASESLPIGMLSEADYDTKEKKLYDGDYILMMSDGIGEVLGERLEEVVFHAGKKQNDRTPQGIAGEILQEALEACGYRPKDDMTVLAAELVKKQLPFYLRKG